MIQRRRDYVKREPTRSAHKVYIVCEGLETEPRYFKFFEGLSSNLHLLILPPEEGTDPAKLLLLAMSKFYGDSKVYSLDYGQNDEVWFVIDTDTWEKEGKIAPLRQFCEERNSLISKEYSEVKQYSAWNVAQSNPSFEIWLYYHFFEGKPDAEAVSEHTSFKAFVNSSISGGFDFEKDQVYLGNAIHNASDTFEKDNAGQVSTYSTEMFNLGQRILPFVETELSKLRNKLG